MLRFHNYSRIIYFPILAVALLAMFSMASCQKKETPSTSSIAGTAGNELTANPNISSEQSDSNSPTFVFTPAPTLNVDPTSSVDPTPNIDSAPDADPMPNWASDPTTTDKIANVGSDHNVGIIIKGDTEEEEIIVENENEPVGGNSADNRDDTVTPNVTGDATTTSIVCGILLLLTGHAMYIGLKRKRR